jgi:hypothetical protein
LVLINIIYFLFQIYFIFHYILNYYIIFLFYFILFFFYIFYFFNFFNFFFLLFFKIPTSNSIHIFENTTFSNFTSTDSTVNGIVFQISVNINKLEFSKCSFYDIIGHGKGGVIYHSSSLLLRYYQYFISFLLPFLLILLLFQL